MKLHFFLVVISDVLVLNLNENCETHRAIKGCILQRQFLEKYKKLVFIAR